MFRVFVPRGGTRAERAGGSAAALAASIRAPSRPERGDQRARVCACARFLNSLFLIFPRPETRARSQNLDLNRAKTPSLSGKNSVIVGQKLRQNYRSIFTIARYSFNPLKKQLKKFGRRVGSTPPDITTNATAWEVTTWLQEKSWNHAK